MKTRRQLKILELVRNVPVRTQEELTELLRQQGIEATQATVSRDLKELGLVKVPFGEEEYRYAVPEDHGADAQPGDRLLRIFRECVVGVEASDNVVVVTTLPATADAVCEVIDTLRLEPVIGTMAGERTVFVVVRPAEQASFVVERLRQLLR